MNVDYECDKNWLILGKGEPFPNGTEKFEAGGREALVNGLSQAMSMFTKVLESNDQVIIRALLSNLEAFSRTVGQDKVQQDRIKNLEEECEELRNTIKELKDRLAGLEEKHKPGNSHYFPGEELKKSTET